MNTVVIAFGRMNPPTIGHLKLVDTMEELAEPTGNRARLYLSHSVDKKGEFKNPLDYETKLKYVRKAFQSKIDVVDSDAKTIIFVLHDLYEEGFTDIIYVGGSDRIGGEEDMTAIIKKYNGYETKPNMYYNFNSISFEDAGERDENSDDLVSKASGSLARKCVVDNNKNLFIKLSPLSKSDASDLFDELSDIYVNERKMKEGVLKLTLKDDKKDEYDSNGFSYHSFEYYPMFIEKFQDAINKKQSLVFNATDKTSKPSDRELIKPIEVTPDDCKELLKYKDNRDVFLQKIIDFFKNKDSSLTWVSKPKDIALIDFDEVVYNTDVKLNTNFQEAIQGYIIQKYWNNPYEGSDKNFIDDLCADPFKSKINWNETNIRDEDPVKVFKHMLKGSLTKRDNAMSNSWLNYFITLAKDGGKKIRDLYSGPEAGLALSRLNRAPTVYARGLVTDLQNETNTFFSEAILKKPKDTVNKADILLDFDSGAAEYYKQCAAADSIEEYSNICDQYLSSGMCLGISLKKGTDDLHVELLARTTSINENIFGENAAKAIVYENEGSPNNTFKPIDTLGDPKNEEHIVFKDSSLQFVPYITDKNEEGKTCALHVEVNDNSNMKESFGDYVHISIRSNNGNFHAKSANVTVEAMSKRSGTQAQMGKLVDPLKDITNMKDRLAAAKSGIEKINIFLDMFTSLMYDEAGDLKLATLISSTGYPLVRKDGEKNSLLMAPIIKLS